ncbi:MAG: hypothetical protein FD131_3312 [Rhodocyclaceae bacterium]|nr:MAG: hypothetical protein FD131_3312 [Rhodocyclaceae bacterium]
MERVARTSSGSAVSLTDCERLQAQRLGFESNLAVLDEPPRFEVTLSYPHAALPDTKLGLFLVVNDDGYPFLLGCARTSWGMDVRYNSYINPLLERDLRNIAAVDVVELAGTEKRTYKVPLLHCFE